MSNYPPGVSGNEYPISGPDFDGELKRACLAQNGRVKAQHIELAESLRFIRSICSNERLTLKDIASHLDHAIELATHTFMVDFDECPFEGEVAAYGYRGLIEWTCPLCGFEHEEDHTPDPPFDTVEEREEYYGY